MVLQYFKMGICIEDFRVSSIVRMIIDYYKIRVRENIDAQNKKYGVVDGINHM